MNGRACHIYILSQYFVCVCVIIRNHYHIAPIMMGRGIPATRVQVTSSSIVKCGEVVKRLENGTCAFCISVKLSVFQSSSQVELFFSNNFWEKSFCPWNITLPKSHFVVSPENTDNGFCFYLSSLEFFLSRHQEVWQFREVISLY